MPVSWGVVAAVVNVPSRRSRAIGSSRVEKDFMVDSIVMRSFWIFFCRGWRRSGEREERYTHTCSHSSHTFSSAAFLNDVRFHPSKSDFQFHLHQTIVVLCLFVEEEKTNE